VCTPEFLLGFIIASESFTLIALGFVFAAMLSSSNPFSSGGSPPLLGIALANLALALGSLSIAVSRMGACTIGPCSTFGATAFGLSVALLAALTVLAASTAGTIVPSSVPFAGGVLVAGLAISMTATGALFPELARAVASLEACIRGLAGPSPGAEVAIVIGYVVLAFAIVTTGAVGNQSPFGAKKG
jgi:hypothetical protein